MGAFGTQTGGMYGGEPPLFADDEGYYRSVFFPARVRQDTGAAEAAWPGMVADPIRAWMRAIDAVRTGQQPSTADALDVSLSTLGGGLVGRAGMQGGNRWATAAARAGEPETLSSRTSGMYNFPSKPPRPFELDYPSGAPADASGRLLTDIEGRPLGAATVVGRRVVGGHDEALPPEGAFALGEATTGRRPQGVAASQLGQKEVGQLVTETDRRSGDVTRRIFYNQNASPEYVPFGPWVVPTQEDDRAKATAVGEWQRAGGLLPDGRKAL